MSTEEEIAALLAEIEDCDRGLRILSRLMETEGDNDFRSEQYAAHSDRWLKAQSRLSILQRGKGSPC